MSRTFLRYLLFQVPEWGLVGLLLLGLHRFTDAPPALLWGGAVAFLVKDLALYPWLWRAYEHVGHEPGEDLIGRAGVATSAVAGNGWVRVGSELWRAEAEGAPIAKGAAIRVRALDGHVLVVTPEVEVQPTEGSARATGQGV